MKKNVNKVEDNTNVLLSYILCILMILIDENPSFSPRFEAFFIL